MSAHSTKIVRIVTIFVTMASFCWSASAPPDAEYIGGTVRAMPPKTAGSLDLSDPSELRFRFGSSSVRVSYSSIHNFRFSEMPLHRRTLAQVPVPLTGPPPDRIFDLSYSDESRELATVSFRLLGQVSRTAEWIVSERVEAAKLENGHSGTNSAAGDPGEKLPESWWGDKYWRTTRNQANWRTSQVNSGQSAAGNR